MLAEDPSATRLVLSSAAVVLLCSALVAVAPAAGPLPAHECTVTANNFTYSPSRIEVRQNEIVGIAFRAVDVPHTFTIDAYRIAKRAGIGQTVVIEMRADRAGMFPIYCSLNRRRSLQTHEGVTRRHAVTCEYLTPGIRDHVWPIEDIVWLLDTHK